jgi:hypothetical protein
LPIAFFERIAGELIVTGRTSASTEVRRRPDFTRRLATLW